MNFFQAPGIFRSRYAVAVVAGLLLAVAFPKAGISGLAWIAPGLLAGAALGKAGWERFRIGYMAGLAFYLASLYWLLNIPYRWHGIPLGPAAGWLSLSAFLALFPATWLWLLSGRRNPELISSGTPNEEAGSAKKEIFPIAALTGVLSPHWSERMMWALRGAVIWVALEMLVARIFSGFPWDLLGVSQYRLLPLIQISSVTGVYGLSFLVIWVSLCLLSAAVTVVRKPTLRSAWITEIFLPGATVLSLFIFGFHQLGQNRATTRFLKVTLIQPSIPQTLIWDPSGDDVRFQELLRLSEAALTNKPDLLLWPEAAVPKLLRHDEATFKAVTNLAGSHHVWMIVGADDVEVRRGPGDSKELDYYNSSFLISDDGRLMNRYRKRSLVIFGEYIPLVTWLPFIKFFTPIEGGFTRGDRPVPFGLEDLNVRTSVLICFEDVFPHLAREYSDEEMDFLVNLTNNGWFGEGAAQWQHATTAIFRAVENGIPLIRCSNNGLTCWVDEHGRLREVFRDNRGSVYGKGLMTVEMPLLEKGEKRAATFYHQHGDLFGWSCVALAILALLSQIWKARRKSVVKA